MLLEYNPTQGKVTGECGYKTFQPLPPLDTWIQSYWQLSVPKGQFQYHSVPDNCVDWIINIGCFDDNFLIPPFLSPTLFYIDGPASFFGIRFRILGHKGLVCVPVGEWGETDSVMAQELLPRDIVYAVFEVITNAECFDMRCKSLSAVMHSAITSTNIDPRLARYVRYCYENVGSYLDLSDHRSSEFGVSARQLRRLVKEHIGILPKDFGKVLRFQCALKAINNAPQHSKPYLDYYYDQPHFVREFKRFSGVTPTQFKKMSVLYNQ
ncbi:AraC family transcriptional regulator [Marinomonas piezotolerans]|uniref:AraC family transcriptional regulator n=1 Tax=Marinomonas piezotolerans TaxID=2213058 RepID=A0A370U9C7_9GAMM|nr:helix-turn-helix domain-containing protein [Marinomonas piezotolerans]RDL44396.1 AraC family transcriptional regulator [Marinomonas piezotolerans]